MDKKTLRQNFTGYMKNRFPEDKYIGSTVSLAFHAERHGDELGVNFDDIIARREIPDCYQKNLENSFIGKGSSNPSYRAKGYTKALQYLLDFIKGEPIPVRGQETGDVKPQRTRRTSSSVEIERPTKETVRKYLAQWEQKPNFEAHWEALHLLFTQTFPCNTNINEVLIKYSSVSVLNAVRDFGEAYDFAQHIVSLNIDSRLKEGDVQLVNDISRPDGIKKQMFSIATKYCSHHNPEVFPIYDRYVEKALVRYQEIDVFSDFREGGLRDYPTFKKAIIAFRREYGLEAFSFTETDRYLWLFGQEL